MAVRFACRCGKKLKATDDKIGRKVLCPSCGNPVSVPEEDTIDVDEIRGGTSASNLASDLLKRSAKKKADEPYVDVGEEGGVGYDYLEIGVTLLKQAVPAIAGVVVLCIVLYWLSNAVMTTDPKLPELGRVSGTVTLDGKPLPGAAVTFLPQAKRDKANPDIQLAPSIARTDASGEYTLTYTRDVEGAAVGYHKIMVQLPKAGQEQIDPKYNANTILVEEVQPGRNTIDLKVESVGSK